MFDLFTQKTASFCVNNNTITFEIFSIENQIGHYSQITLVYLIKEEFCYKIILSTFQKKFLEDKEYNLFLF